VHFSDIGASTNEAGGGVAEASGKKTKTFVLHGLAAYAADWAGAPEYRGNVLFRERWGAPVDPAGGLDGLRHQ